MLTHTNVVSIVLLAATALMVCFFAYFQSVKRQLYLQAWTFAWGLLVLHYAATIFMPESGNSLGLAMLSTWLISGVALALFCAAQIYSHARPWIRVAMGALMLFGVWIVAFGRHVIPLSPQIGIAAAFHRRGAVERVLGLAVPEIGLRNAALGALRGQHLERVGGGLQRLEEAVGSLVAARLAHLLAEHGRIFEPVAVTVDDRVVEFGVDLLRAQMTAHDVSSRAGAMNLA